VKLEWLAAQVSWCLFNKFIGSTQTGNSAGHPSPVFNVRHHGALICIGMNLLIEHAS
jgi:hypothetical protein